MKPTTTSARLVARATVKKPAAKPAPVLTDGRCLCNVRILTPRARKTFKITSPCVLVEQGTGHISAVCPKCKSLLLVDTKTAPVTLVPIEVKS